MNRVGLLSVLLGSFLLAAPAAAQPRGADLVSGLYAGGCGDVLTAPAASLPAPELPDGAAVGAAQARTVAISFTTVPLSLDALLATDHVVALVPAGETAPAACGAVGGVPTPTGDIIIELSEHASSGLSGIAFLYPNSADASQTDVSLFLAGLGTTRRMQQPAAPGAAPVVTPANETSAVSTVAPAPAAALENYISPTWGFTLAYDPAVWTIGDGPTTDGDIDSIGFTSFGTNILVAGFSYVGDAPSCAAALAASMAQDADVVASEPLVVNGGQVAGGDARDAYQAVVLTRTMQDGSSGEQAFYVRCIELVPNAAMVAIQQWSAAVFYDVAAQQREELLSGLVLP